MGTPPGNAEKPLADSLYVVGRYALFQLPEMMIVGFALLAGLHFDVVSQPLAWLLMGVWIVKEIALFPFVRAAYEPSDPGVTSKLIGRTGVAITRLDPRGSVRVGPELWRACAVPDTLVVEAGAEVGVKSVEGFTLHVTPARSGQADDPPPSDC